MHARSDSIFFQELAMPYCGKLYFLSIKIGLIPQNSVWHRFQMIRKHRIDKFLLFHKYAHLTLRKTLKCNSGAHQLAYGLIYATGQNQGLL